jgi:hypothetical protein
VADEREVRTVSSAFSKSFNSGERGRNLCVVGGGSLPKSDLRGERPWDLHLSRLLGRYSGEDAQNEGVALTRFSLETRREYPGSFGKPDDVSIRFRHQESPEALYFELEPLSFAGFIRKREDRHGVSTSQWLKVINGPTASTGSGKRVV